MSLPFAAVASKQINVKPTAKFQKAWAGWLESKSVHQREYVCAGLLWLMGLGHDERDAWIKEYKQWESNEGLAVPPTLGGRRASKR